MKAWFVHSPGCLWGYSTAKIPQRTTTWCLVSTTMQTDAVNDQGGFTAQAAMNWSGRSRRTPVVRHMVKWPPFSTMCRYIYLTTCLSVFLQLPVSWKIFRWASWVIFLVAASAVSRWTDFCPHCGVMSMSDVFNLSPANWSDYYPLAPRWGGCVSMSWWCGIGEEDDNKTKWKLLRTV